jgi:hypothetical protein
MDGDLDTKKLPEMSWSVMVAPQATLAHASNQTKPSHNMLCFFSCFSLFFTTVYLNHHSVL